MRWYGMLLGFVCLPLPARALSQSLVGPEACKACHPHSYEAWRGTAHARASDAVAGKSRGDPRCASCHSADRERGVDGVSCETCHGPGQFYAASYVMRDRELSRLVGLVDPGEGTCRVCHNDSTPSLERFEYARRLPLIEHGGRPGPAQKGRPADAAHPPPGRSP